MLVRGVDASVRVGDSIDDRGVSLVTVDGVGRASRSLLGQSKVVVL